MRFAVASLALVAAPAVAQPITARAHVTAIYNAIPRPGFDYGKIRYAPELAGLMARDRRFSKLSGDVGALDGIPFCDCQDNEENYRLMRVTEARPVRGMTRVTVNLRNGPVRHFAVDLIHAREIWLVADIRSPMTPSLLAFLRREVPREEYKLLKQGKH